MAANVLNSPRAVQMSVFVVRAFLKMRALLGDKRDLAQKLASLEKELKSDSMFTKLSSSRFCNESWTSSILQPSQLRRPSRELDSIREPVVQWSCSHVTFPPPSSVLHARCLCLLTSELPGTPLPCA
jgi:hypothetical protein